MKNNSYLRKVKEGVAILENRSSSLRMEGKRSGRSGRSGVDGDVKNFLYKTLQIKSNIKYKKKALNLIG